MSSEQQCPIAGLRITSVFRALSLSLALTLPSLVSAVTLGPINVLSNLGEPLKAVIEVLDLQGEQNLTVALAPADEFSKAGNTRSILMQSLKLGIVQQGRKSIITLTTDKPLDQPIYGLLLEFSANGESKIAEFAVLPEEAIKVAEPAMAIEPTVTEETVSPTPTPPIAQTAQASAEDQPVAVIPGADPTETAVKTAENIALVEAQPTSRQHSVQRGQNLTVIARQYSVSDADLNKFIAATFSENPDAFIKNNLHYLKAGAVLALPSDEAVSMVDDRSARTTITTQWQTFKDLVAAMDPTGGKATDAQPTRSISRKVSKAKRGGEQASGDQLTLSALTRSENAAKSKTEEEAIAAKKAADEASERVRLLEKNVRDLKTALQPNPLTVGESKKTDSKEADNKEENMWGILSSPARDLMMQGATVLLLAALVLIALIRRNKAST
ncbi:Motility protein FimV, N-terminal [Oxalobacteraceae bacterium]